MQVCAQSVYNYLDKYLIEVRSQGRYAFTIGELKNKFKLTPNALNQILHRLKQKEEIA
jgi:hypothetical protein